MPLDLPTPAADDVWGAQLNAAIDDRYNLLAAAIGTPGSISVKSYGAIGDGVADDTAAINSAIVAANGNAVYFPAGTYKFTSLITLISNTTLRGAGRGATTLLQAYWPDVSTQGSIHAAGTLGTAQSCTTPALWATTITGITSTTGWNAGDYVLIQSDDYYWNQFITRYKGEFLKVKSVDSASQVTVYGQVRDNYTTNPKITQVAFAKNIAIEDLTIKNSGYDTHASYFFTAWYVKGLRVSRCEFINADRGGIIASSCYDVLIDDNSFTDFNDNTAAQRFGYGIIAERATENMRVIGNSMQRGRHLFTTGGLAGYYGGPRNLVISGNTVSQNTAVGIDTHQIGDDILIEGNVVDNIADAAFSIRSTNTTLRGNKASWCKNGVVVHGYTDNVPSATGSVTSATTTTLTDTSKTWTTNQWAGYQVIISGGAGLGQSYVIASNSSNQLTISGTWTTTPDVTSTYLIGGGTGGISYGCQVVGNEFRKITQHGMSIYDTDRLTIADNTVEGCGQHGIYVLGNATALAIINNRIVNAHLTSSVNPGMLVFDSAVTVTGARVERNFFGKYSTLSEAGTSPGGSTYGIYNLSSSVTGNYWVYNTSVGLTATVQDPYANVNYRNESLSGNLSVSIPSVPQPSDVGFIYWTVDPATVNPTSSSLVNGTVYLIPVYIRATVTISKVWFHLGTVAVTPTAGQNFAGLINSSGSLLSSGSADTVFTGTTGPTSVTLGTPQTVPPGMYWIAVLANAATPPQLGRYNGGSGTYDVQVGGSSPSTYRWAVNGTGQTALSNITPTANTQSGAFSFWGAVS